MAQEVNLQVSSLTIRVTESGAAVGVECSWSDFVANNKISHDTQAFVCLSNVDGQSLQSL